MKHILTITSHGDTPALAVMHARSVLDMVSHRSDRMDMASGDASGMASANWSMLECVDDGDEKTSHSEDSMCRKCGGVVLGYSWHPDDFCQCHLANTNTPAASL